MTCGAGLALLGRGGRELVSASGVCVPDEYWPSQTGDPYWANVTLLLHCDGANGGTTFTDSSTNNLTATVSGSAALSTSGAKFGTAAALFTTSADGVSFTHASMALGSGDATIEFWVKQAVATGTQQGVVGNVNTATYWFFGKSGSNKLFFNADILGTLNADAAMTVDVWYRVAAVRISGTWRLYIDGQLQVTNAPIADSTTYSLPTTVHVGNYTSTPGDSFSGSIDDLRITKGVGRYTGNFTVPSAAHPDAYGAPTAGHTVLSLHGEALVDSSSDPKAVTAFGNAAVSTAQQQFGTSSYVFDGTGDYLSVANHQDFDFGTGDFTVEFWCRPTDTAHVTYMVTRRDGTNQGWYIYFATNEDLGFGWNGPSNGAQVFGSVTTGVWQHIAFSRAAGVRYSFVDGVLVGSVADTVNYSNVTTGLAVGADYNGAVASLNGYIDELRITKGVARYTANFTPATLANCDGGTELVVVTPPPTTVPPDVYTDPLWSSVLFLSAMDLTKVNLKTSVAYTLDSASVTATDPFDGAGALACVYPPSAPTSTPFEPPELAGVTLRGSSGGCVEFWLRPDAWEPWVSGAFRWANLAQQDSSTGDPLWALGIVDERQSDGSIAPCLQLFSHYLDGSTYLETWRRTQAALLLPFDGLWHHIALDFRYYGGFAQTLVLYLDGVELTALTAPSYTAGETIQFGGQTVFAPLEGVSPYTAPAGITSSTFDGALDEIRVTASSRYSGSFVVPHYAFPRS